MDSVSQSNECAERNELLVNFHIGWVRGVLANIHGDSHIHVHVAISITGTDARHSQHERKNVNISWELIETDMMHFYEMQSSEGDKWSWRRIRNIYCGSCWEDDNDDNVRWIRSYGYITRWAR